jgi:V8-like Glu-specific endopeptidase
MDTRTRRALRAARTLVISSAACTLVMTGVSLAGTVSASGPSALAATSHPNPVPATTRTFTAAEQRSTAGYWTTARMRAATPLAGSSAVARPATVKEPAGVPNPVEFNGVPTVGALFFTTGGKAHFCTASAVTGAAGDLALTAAHCVYSGGYVTNVAYAPEWHSGDSPYGLWPIRMIVVAQGWITAQNQDLDFAFLILTRQDTSSIVSVTGGLRPGFSAGYKHAIHVIGYNDTGSKPIVCGTTSAEFTATQLEFYCNDYWDGTSGGPWILDYNGTTGAGIVFGDIGGYEQGGDYPWESYSPYYAASTESLYQAAERDDLAISRTIEPG